MANDIGGVWRTIGGRRVFIKDGQSLADAMKASGKFKNKKDKAKDIANMDPEKFKQEAELEKKVAIEKANFKKDEKEKTLEEQYAEDLHNGKTKGTFQQWRDKKEGKEPTTQAEINNLERIGERKVSVQNSNDKEEGLKLYKEKFEQYEKTTYNEKGQNIDGDKKLAQELRKIEKDYDLKGKDTIPIETEIAQKHDKIIADIQDKNRNDREALRNTEKAYGKNYLTGEEEKETYNEAINRISKMNSLDDRKEAIRKLEKETGADRKVIQEALDEKDYDRHLGEEYDKRFGEDLDEKTRNLEDGKEIHDVFRQMDAKEMEAFAKQNPESIKKMQDYLKSKKTNNDDYEYNLYKHAFPFHEKTEKEKKYAEEVAEYYKDKDIKQEIAKAKKEAEKSSNDIMNEKIRSRGKSKVEEDDLPKHTEIKTQGTSNRKEVSDNIQAHILDYYTEDYTGENISPAEAFVRQMDAMGESNMWRAGQKIAEGGSYLIYNGDMADFLDELKINPKGKTFSEDKAFDMYTSLIGRESAKLYDRIQKNSYKKYMKSHPLSKMSFEEFKDMNKK